MLKFKRMYGAIFHSRAFAGCVEFPLLKLLAPYWVLGVPEVYINSGFIAKLAEYRPSCTLR